ncbi:MAG: DNA polymerase III subunit chi [Pseudomonadota bacterium]
MRVDFYILNDATPQQRFACRLLNKIYHQSEKVSVLCTQDEIRSFDDLLWQFEDISFIPHDLAENHNEQSPITLATSLTQISDRKLLLNLTAETISEGYERVIEIVPNDETQRQASRQKYKQYQAIKADIHIHQLY